MKISYIYDQGSSKYREDGLFVCEPFFGVLDGVSAPYSPAHPPEIFNGGMSGGEMVSRVVEKQFAKIKSLRSLQEAVLLASRDVARKQLRQKVPFDGGKLAGASFAITKITSDRIEIIQGCDAFALWVMKDGSVGIAEAQNERSETFLNDKVVELMREVASERGFDLEAIDDETRSEVRAEMWDRFYPILLETRREYVNNPSFRDSYGLLNGQPELEHKWCHMGFPRREVRTLLLFTDGMVPWWGSLEGLPIEEVARMVHETYSEGGLVGLFARARGIEEKSRATSYIDTAEATAIAIEF